jgi:hypothetical protein
MNSAGSRGARGSTARQGGFRNVRNRNNRPLNRIPLSPIHPNLKTSRSYASTVASISFGRWESRLSSAIRNFKIHPNVVRNASRLRMRGSRRSLQPRPRECGSGSRWQLTAQSAERRRQSRSILPQGRPVYCRSCFLEMNPSILNGNGKELIHN